jgi:CheY-like chemotaxis protein
MHEAVGKRGDAILLAEDNADDVLLTQIAFKKAGCNNRLVHVSNGEHALKYLLASPPYTNRAKYPFPRLLLLDLAMPLLDGWGLLSHIRGVAQWNHLPVIVLTGSIELRNVKPLDLWEYVEIVRALAEEWLGTPSAAPQPTLARLSSSRFLTVP